MLLFRSYLLKANYEWLLDNKLTPYLIIDSNANDIIFPVKYIKFENLILNISPDAVQNFIIKNKRINFYTCFNKQSYYIQLPIYSIIAIYGYENNIGFIFYEDKMKLQNNIIKYDFLSEDCFFFKDSSFSKKNKFNKMDSFYKKTFFSKNKKSILRLIK